MAKNELARIKAIEEARKRRAVRGVQRHYEFQSFLNNVVSKVHMSLRQRVRLATEYLKNKVVLNISRPVTKQVATSITGHQQTTISDRSKPGEFPKADTTNLMKTIFGVVQEPSPGVAEGFIGTPVDYGVILELQMDRSFLVRSLTEEKRVITKILTGPIA